jgi:amidohydrolase
MTNIMDEVKNLFEYTKALRRDFHQHPELGFQEFRTAAIVADELEKLDLDRIDTNVAKTGVVGILKGGQPGPVVLLRFDMDALPIQEQTGAEYASTNEGVMHACGHDAHTAIGLTVAKILSRRRDSLSGTVKFVFQPAEEGQGGAELMVKEGVLENPRPDYCFGVHVWNDMEVGKFGITEGPVMAGAGIFKVIISGKGGHGAAPHKSIDPILAASHVVTALQSITSRSVAPLDSAVVTIGSIHGGTAFNIIPPEVELQGTIRMFTKEVSDLVLERLEMISNGVAEAMGCKAEVEILPVTPAVVNDRDLAKQAQATANRLFPDAEIKGDVQTMGSEDFAYMMEEIPGCYIFVGSANAEKGLDAMHHHPRFDIDETSLENAVGLVASLALEYLV